MDPVTHMAMGAAISQVSMGDEDGWRPLLWGAALGALPDLDLLPAMGMDDLARIFFHRGITHSLLAVAILAPIAGWIAARRRPPGSSSGIRRWMLLAAFALLSHIILDCATTYGTRIFLPFDGTRLAWSLVSVVDLCVSGFLVVGLMLAWRYHRRPFMRRFMAGAGILLCVFYFGLAGFCKVRALTLVARGTAGDPPPRRLIVTPSVGSCLLWNGVAEYDDHYRVGLVSILDRGQAPFVNVPNGRHLRERWKGMRALSHLSDFANDCYTLEERDGTLVFIDLRYGIVQLPGEEPEAVISYAITNPGARAVVWRVKNRERPFTRMMRIVIDRTAGIGREGAAPGAGGG